MKKLFALKKWLTLSEAAKYLTIMLGEDVCVADVLRLALDGHLKLSLNFVNQVTARKGKVVPIEEASYDTIDPLFSDLFENFLNNLQAEGKPELEGPIRVMRGISLDDKYVLELENEEFTLKGVYDLPMLGRERLDVEQMFQTLTGGPSVALGGWVGALVCGGDGVMFEIQEGYHQNEICGGSNAELSEFKAQIVNTNMEPLQIRELIEEQLTALEIIHANQKSNHNSGEKAGKYIPAGNLPDDCAIVVRTDVLRAFEQSISDNPDKSDKIDKPLTTTERTSLLLIIAAFCINKSIDPASRDAVSKVQNLIKFSNFKMDDDTVRKFLKQIPDAIERRT